MKKILSAVSLLLIILIILCTASAETNTVYTQGTVNLRKKASVDSAVITCLKDRTECEVITSKTDARGIDWYKVEVNGKTGWISSVYASAEKNQGTIRGWLAATGNVNLREVANGRPILDIIPEGETVAWFRSKTVNGLKWYLVRYNGRIGWACGSYLKGEKTEKTVRYVCAAGGDSNVRTGAKTTAKIIGILYEGERAEYLNETRTDARGVDWYRIDLDGTEGWISSAYTVIRK